MSCEDPSPVQEVGARPVLNPGKVIQGTEVEICCAGVFRIWEQIFGLY